jgi:hypothetical protein
MSILILSSHIHDIFQVVSSCFLCMHFAYHVCWCPSNHWFDHRIFFFWWRAQIITLLIVLALTSFSKCTPTRDLCRQARCVHYSSFLEYKEVWRSEKLRTAIVKLKFFLFSAFWADTRYLTFLNGVLFQSHVGRPVSLWAELCANFK